MHGNGFKKLVYLPGVIMLIEILLQVANPIHFHPVHIMSIRKKDKWHAIRYQCLIRPNVPRLVKTRSMMCHTKQTNIMPSLFMYVTFALLHDILHLLFCAFMLSPTISFWLLWQYSQLSLFCLLTQFLCFFVSFLSFFDVNRLWNQCLTFNVISWKKVLWP